MKVTVTPIVIDALGTVTKDWYREWRTSGDYPYYYIIEIDQNTEKSPGDLRRLVVTQTLVKDHQLTLM